MRETQSGQREEAHAGRCRWRADAAAGVRDASPGPFLAPKGGLKALPSPPSPRPRPPSAPQAVVGCCCALGGGLLYARARANLAMKALPPERSERISERPIMSEEDEEEGESAKLNK